MPHGKAHEANRKNSLREPDAGNPLVRFDEGEFDQKWRHLDQTPYSTIAKDVRKRPKFIPSARLRFSVGRGGG